MKVLRVSSYLEGGGAEANMRLFSQHLVNHGAQVAIFYLGGSNNSQKQLEKLGIKVIRGSFSLKGLAKFLAFVSYYQPTVIHANLFKAEVFGAIAKHIFRIPFFVNRDIDYWPNMGKVSQLIQKYFVYYSADVVIAISKAVKDYVVKAYDYKKPNLVVLYYGIDYDPFFNATLLFPKNSNVFRIGFAGRFVYQKAPEVLFKALVHLTNKPINRHIEVLIAGTGPLEKVMRAYANALSSLAPNISFKFLGFVEDIAGFYKSLDVFVLPSRFEGFGLVFLEALASRVVVLAPNIRPLDEVLGSHAVFFKKDDALDLAQKLYEAIVNYNDIKISLFKNVNHHFKKFDAKAQSLRLFALYNSVVKYSKS